MGMYTEIYVNVDLIEETPQEVIDTLKMMCDDKCIYDDFKETGHPDRWFTLFCDGSYYTPLTSCAFLKYDEANKFWSLLGKGDIKNYEHEIEAFFKWLSPWVDSDGGDGVFMGYYRYEEHRAPTLVYSNEEIK